MIKINAAEPDDFLHVNPDGTEGNPVEYSDFCFTLLDDEEIIALLGGIKTQDHIYRVYMLLSDFGVRKPIAYTKACKTILGLAMKMDPKVHRIELTVRESFVSSQNWVKVLGFEEEGLLHDYESDTLENHIIYYLPSNKWSN